MATADATIITVAALTNNFSIARMRQTERITDPNNEGDIKMAYIRKTIDRWDIMSNYGYGTEGIQGERRRMLSFREA